jgi:hypothetical protein
MILVKINAISIFSSSAEYEAEQHLREMDKYVSSVDTQ